MPLEQLIFYFKSYESGAQIMLYGQLLSNNLLDFLQFIFWSLNIAWINYTRYKTNFNRLTIWSLNSDLYVKKHTKDLVVFLQLRT